MNNSKKIAFSKSTLVSLKAELLRKQDEVNKAKLDPRNQAEHFKPAPSAQKSEKKVKAPKQKEPVDPEVSEALRKSRDVLEKKALLYESLSSGAKSTNDDQYLVEFHKKVKEKRDQTLDNKAAASSSSSHQECTIYEDKEGSREKEDDGAKDRDDDDSEWVEYVDCFGRTRTCHKSDLQAMKDREKIVKDSLLPKTDSREVQSLPPKQFVKEGEQSASTETELQAPDAYREQLRMKWEEKERELLDKDKIHYQDVLFDEARAHGVSYYAFSTEESARARQHAELRDVRVETERAQHDAEERRARRDLLMQERVRAARARQRVRAGLPPEEEEPTPSVTDLLLDFVSERKREFEERDKEEQRKKREEQEKERQKDRESYVREWDIGKDSQEGDAFKEMTQEQWVEKQRGKRDREFAPFETRENVGKRARAFDDKGVDVNKSNLTWDDVRPKVQNDSLNIEVQDESKHLYSSSRNTMQTAPTLTFSSVAPIPIINELSDENDDDDDDEDADERESGRNEVAPPPTYDYYGPSSSKTKRYDKVTREDVEESIEKGLNSLRKKNEKRYGTNRDFEDFNM